MTIQELINKKPPFLTDERWEKVKKDREKIIKRLQILKSKKD